MTWGCHRKSKIGGSAPATPGFNAVAPEWLRYGAALAAPAVPAAESTLGSHPCVALSSAQVLSEWITSTPPVNAFAANGTNPLNFVSHSKGSLHPIRCNLLPPLGVRQAKYPHPGKRRRALLESNPPRNTRLET